MCFLLFWGGFLSFPPSWSKGKRLEWGPQAPGPAPGGAANTRVHQGPAQVFWVLVTAPSVTDIAYENRKAGRGGANASRWSPAHGLGLGLGGLGRGARGWGSSEVGGGGGGGSCRSWRPRQGQGQAGPRRGAQGGQSVAAGACRGGTLAPRPSHCQQPAAGRRGRAAVSAAVAAACRAQLQRVRRAGAPTGPALSPAGEGAVPGELPPLGTPAAPSGFQRAWRALLLIR